MVIVTGMHRSGTSLVANLLAEIGMDLGDPSGMLAADAWNARGYWENLRVLVCNDRLILGGGPFYPLGFYEVPRERRSPAMQWRMKLLWARFILRMNLRAVEKRAERLDDEMRSIVRDFKGVAVKDPRFCVTLPAWRERDGVERVLVVIRRPTPCAASMQRRNGMARRHGLTLWRLHYGTILRQMVGLPATFVDFHRLLDARSCDVELDRVAAFAQLPVDAALKTHLRDNIVNPKLATDSGDQPLDDDPINELYPTLQRCHAQYDRPKTFERP
jgi:hypothetical protein